MTCVTLIAIAITRPLGMLAMSRHGKLRVLISLSALIAAIGSVTSLTPVGGWNAGQASFYGGQPDGMNPNNPSFGTLEGSCGYGLLSKNTWPFWSVGALATGNSFFKSDPMSGCGECFEVQCVEDGPALGPRPGSCQKDPTRRNIVIQITDSCPNCSSDQIDIQANTWAKIANPSPSGGRINMQYRRVECVPPSGLVVAVDNTLGSGSNGWIRMQINMAGGTTNVKAVALQSASGGPWQECHNSFGASWEVAQKPEPPINVRITNYNGDTVIAHSAISNGRLGDQQTNVQFQVTDPSDVQPSGNVLTPADTNGAGSNPSSGGPMLKVGSSKQSSHKPRFYQS